MIFLILLTAIVLPLFAKNKSLALVCSMCILFIPWGLQYETVNDWPGNLLRWNLITQYLSNEVIEGGGKEIEGIYVFLVRLFQDLGFFGWLMISAIFELSVIYHIIKNFVPKQFYWLAIFILMMRIDYGFLFINSNRQSLAVFTTVIASIILCKEDFKSFFFKNTYTRLLIAITLIFIARHIHSSAIIALLLIPIYIVAKNTKSIRKWLIVVANLLFISRFFYNASELQSTLETYMNMLGIQDAYNSYLIFMDNSLINYSMIEQIIYLMIMNAALFMYNRFNTPTRYFVLCSIFSIIIIGFLYGDLGRICQYYYVYLIALVPIIVSTLPETNFKIIKKYSKPIYTIIIMYVVYSFIRDIHHEYYNSWLNFKTILSAPEWI